MISLVSTWLCDAPHRVSHAEKLDKLTEAFAHGWGSGYPALIGYPSGQRIQLLSGSHRIEAARRAGLKVVPIIVHPAEEVARAWGDLEQWRKIMKELP